MDAYSASCYDSILPHYLITTMSSVTKQVQSNHACPILIQTQDINAFGSTNNNAKYRDLDPKTLVLSASH